jgi:hypothetical protein
MKPKSSLPFLEEPVTDPCPEPDESHPSPRPCVTIYNKLVFYG